MEIKSKKMPKTEKMQKMCILLGAIIIIIVLVFMPNGFISAINAIKMKQLSVWELMIMSFLSFVPMWIVIEDIVLGMISCQISYRLKENGIEKMNLLFFSLKIPHMPLHHTKNLLNSVMFLSPCTQSYLSSSHPIYRLF